MGQVAAGKDLGGGLVAGRGDEGDMTCCDAADDCSPYALSHKPRRKQTLDNFTSGHQQAAASEGNELKKGRMVKVCSYTPLRVWRRCGCVVRAAGGDDAEPLLFN